MPESSQNKETIQSTKSILNKVEVSSQQKGETHFCKQSCFRELPDYTEDVEIEWDLFKSAVIASAPGSCGCKCVGSQMDSEKRTTWWNQEVIHAKKTAFRAWLTNKSSEQL